MTSPTPQTTEDAMKKLSLNSSTSPTTSSSSKPRSKPKKQAVADSWEDEESSTSDAEASIRAAFPNNNTTSTTTKNGVAAPPPTPMASSYGTHAPSDADAANNAPWLAASSTGGGYSYRGGQGDEVARRPEKTDAVARRMIASALGVRAPRPTDEQRAYDRAVRDKERKKREEEREAVRRREEEAEKAKAAIWND
ncbi:hypothetical protein GGS21DRAFT_100168 [Xylaria nigripes]|nr:hypothetical protein GGS21DRAFT_100168 [Xylaria nigripes]